MYSIIPWLFACKRPLTGIMVSNPNSGYTGLERVTVSPSFRGLGFLTAPLRDGVITPSILQFAGRILFFPFFGVLY